MMLPDNEADYGDHELEPDEEFDLSELGPEALAWQLLLLINPGDEDAAMRQFSGYREALIEAGGEAAEHLDFLFLGSKTETVSFFCF